MQAADRAFSKVSKEISDAKAVKAAGRNAVARSSAVSLGD